MLFSTAALLALLPAAALAAPANGPLDKRAPLIQARNPSKVVPGKYIVKLRAGSTEAALTKAIGSHKAGHVYSSSSFKGFAGALDAAALDKIRSLPEVEFVEEDSIVTLQTPTLAVPRAVVTQTGAPWNLARISSHTNGATSYRYDSTAGNGTCSYIIDTGIYLGHSEFGGRAVFGANFAGDGSTLDGNGHGTSVAGVVGSTTYGVAKLTTLIAVKVLDSSGSGTNSGVIAGFNYVATDHTTRAGCSTFGSVASIAIGGSYSAAVNSAVTSLVSSGVHVAAAAGGDAANAGNYSPGSAPAVCTIGASNSADAVASSSNYGAVVDMYAPGVSIKTTWSSGATVTLMNTVSGTTYSAAHVAGLGAYILRLRGVAYTGVAVPATLTPQNVCAFLQGIATSGVLTGVPTGTNNLLAYNGI
ncbi:peptidase S8/S53 domain-containing protein, partial [Podospora appendiculata]